jgi:hypothetical protein
MMSCPCCQFEPLRHQQKDRLHAGGLVLLVALDETHLFFVVDLSGSTNAKRGNIDTLDLYGKGRNIDVTFSN